MGAGLVVQLRLHVFTEDQQSSGMYGRDVSGAKVVPIEGDAMSVFDTMALSEGDMGWPLGEVTERGWLGNLSTVQLHIDCVVEDSFFYDRPWRQHLLDSGWFALDEADALSA